MCNNIYIIKEFTDLIVWQKGHQLVLSIYKLDKLFPSHEKYGLGDQLRRASVSITSNIAEGFGRQSLKEKVQFFYQAHGSLTEVKNQIIIASDLGYISLSEFRSTQNQITEVQKLLIGLIYKTKSFIK